ncbi:hypothetical protein J0S82_001710 [Galemys pyrenaicus]|uniref:Uncharacterized protein n=1 Tax=Galemys pyrenaicus TaxID=202257 RepID=A0A8J6DJJ6_GALPY|nr:hypothetical protein J0S82_001710 [Galemys pyrenaicus]
MELKPVREGMRYFPRATSGWLLCAFMLKVLSSRGSKTEVGMWRKLHAAHLSVQKPPLSHNGTLSPKFQGAMMDVALVLTCLVHQGQLDREKLWK